jgi:hypothetical protein
MPRLIAPVNQKTLGLCHCTMDNERKSFSALNHDTPVGQSKGKHRRPQTTCRDVPPEGGEWGSQEGRTGPAMGGRPAGALRTYQMCKPRHNFVYSSGEFSRPYRIDVTPQKCTFSFLYLEGRHSASTRSKSVHKRLVHSVSPNTGQSGTPAMCLCQCRVVRFSGSSNGYTQGEPASFPTEVKVILTRAVRERELCYALYEHGSRLYPN